MALVAVTLTLVTMAALASALAVSSTTETLIALNHRRAAQARAAAEAGLAHAADLVLGHLSASISGGVSPEQALASLLSDVEAAIPSFAAVQSGVELVAAGRGSPRITYEAALFDDDDDDRRGLPLSPADLRRIDENGDPATDTNRTLVISAAGYAGGGARAALEATLAPARLPALLAAGGVERAPTVRIVGRRSVVRANAGSRVPDRSAHDYRGLATHVLHDDGGMTTVATGGTTACGAVCAGGWRFDGRWVLADTPAAGAYFVEGDAHLAASGTATILATGSVTGDAGTLTPYRGGVMLVVDGDAWLAGALRLGSAGFPGLVLVGEQLELRDDAAVHGHVIVRDAGGRRGAVTRTRLGGRASIVYDGRLDGLFFELAAWRTP